MNAAPSKLWNMKGAVRQLKELRRAISCNKQSHKVWWKSTVAQKLARVSCKDRPAACSFGLIWFWWTVRTHARRIMFCFRSILEPMCNFSLLYTVLKISSISYPYQCHFAPSAQKGMGREKYNELNFHIVVAHQLKNHMHSCATRTKYSMKSACYNVSQNLWKHQ